MIFGGSAAYNSKRRQKVARREVYTAGPVMPAFLRWYPLVVNPIVGPKRLTKVLMDGGSGLNIMYAKMLDTMGIDRSHI